LCICTYVLHTSHGTPLRVSDQRSPMRHESAVSDIASNPPCQNCLWTNRGTRAWRVALMHASRQPAKEGLQRTGPGLSPWFQPPSARVSRPSRRCRASVAPRPAAAELPVSRGHEQRQHGNLAYGPAGLATAGPSPPPPASELGPLASGASSRAAATLKAATTGQEHSEP
jgi:hypothetical protein